MKLTLHQQEILHRIPKSTKCVGVEVGVWRGETSYALLSKRKDLTLHMIDPWKAGVPGTAWWKTGSTMPGRDQTEYDRAFTLASDRVAKFGDRAKIIREPALTAVSSFEDESLDFVFLDGDHSFEAVTQEIDAWFPKVKKGGWIGGHDFGTKRNGQVREAVLDRLDTGGLDVAPGSTWFYKK